MKRLLVFLLVSVFMVGACTAESNETEQTVQAVATKVTEATSTMLPTATVTSTPRPTALPTPIFTLDLSRHDPDIFPPIVLEHQPPLIAQSDETVILAFNIVQTIYCGELLGNCSLEPRLYYSYGEVESFQSMLLTTEIVNGMESLVARLPVANQAGESLRYYAEFLAPQAGYAFRYPAAGTIEVFAPSELRSIDLPAEHTVEPGDKVYTFYWGFGPNTVRTVISGESRVGPPAMDVASNGRIAILNPANKRILIYDPGEDKYSNVPLPFPYGGDGDLAFDQNDQLVVCDFVGQGGLEVPEGLPHCYRLSPDGGVVVSAPLFVRLPLRLTEDLRILDYYDYRLITPFTGNEVNSREAQRERQTWELPCRFVVGTDGVFDWYRALFADIDARLAFDVHSDSNLGVIEDFEKTPQGYIMIFSGYEQIRAVWINPSGVVLKDLTLPNGQYSRLSSGGDAAVAQDGSLYVMSSTRNGIEIHFEAAPEP